MILKGQAGQKWPVDWDPADKTRSLFYSDLTTLAIRRLMAQFQDGDLDYVVDDLYDMTGFEDEYDNPFAQNEPETNNGSDPLDSDFEDDFESSKSKTDTSALEARNGKDIQGIPWERLNFSRDEYRETRLKQYRNYENLSRSREDLDKECLQIEKGKTFYDFQFNTRLVKSTIVHFQIHDEGCLLYTCS
nr:hypothetical protein CFP56_06770 [Quercus suber]